MWNLYKVQMCNSYLVVPTVIQVWIRPYECPVQAYEGRMTCPHALCVLCVFAACPVRPACSERASFSACVSGSLNCHAHIARGNDALKACNLEDIPRHGRQLKRSSDQQPLTLCHTLLGTRPSRTVTRRTVASPSTVARAGLTSCSTTTRLR